MLPLRSSGRLGQIVVEKSLPVTDRATFTCHGSIRNFKNGNAKQTYRQYSNQGSGALSDIRDFRLNKGKGPSVEDALNRIACLQLIFGRWMLEGAYLIGMKAFKITKTPREIGNIANKKDISGLLSSKEREMLNKPLGFWTPYYLSELYTYWEELGILQWSVGMQTGVPPYYNQFHENNLLPFGCLVSFNSSDYEEWMENALSIVNPRNNQEIEQQLLLAETWYWRSRVHLILEAEEIKDELDPFARKSIGQRLQSQEVRDFLEKVPLQISCVAKKAHGMGYFPRVVSDDFGVFSFDQGDTTKFPFDGSGSEIIAYKEISDLSYTKLENLSLGRYKAISILNGDLKDFHEPLDSMPGCHSISSTLGYCSRILTHNL